MTSVLIVQTFSLDSDFVHKCETSPYEKVHALIPQSHLQGDIPESKQVEVHPYKESVEIDPIVQDILTEHEQEQVYSHFIKDAQSYINVNVLNDGAIDPDCFKCKKSMHEFLHDTIADKINVKKSYKDIMELSYAQLVELAGQKSVIKAHNAASSCMNFPIFTESDLEVAKSKFLPTYEYIIENYLEGNLYAVDFYSDGKDVYIVSYTQEFTFGQLLDEYPSIFSSRNTEINQHFRNGIPISYTLDVRTLSDAEKEFILGLVQKLKSECYKGVIHLEYKLCGNTGKIGFIEWGARHGANRPEFIEAQYGILSQNLHHELLHDNNTAQFSKEGKIYFPKLKSPQSRFIRIKTNYTKVQQLTKVLGVAKGSFEQFISTYLQQWNVRVRNVTLSVMASREGNLHPYYERFDTYFDYLLELDEENFQQFKTHMQDILEHVVFHDYKQ